MIDKQTLEYFKQSAKDPLLLNTLYQVLDDYVDLQISHDSLESHLADLEHEVEVLTEQLDEAYEHIRFS